MSALLIALMLTACTFLSAQQTKKPSSKKKEAVPINKKVSAKNTAIRKDSTKKDTSNIYVRLKRVAYKRHLTKMAFDAIFVDPEPKEYRTKPEQPQKKPVNPYLKYQGKVIRKIRIMVLDPFGYSVTDTVCKDINSFQRAANRLHVTTRRWVIVNRLLFEENKKLNAIEISESERLLRQTTYVNDAHIDVQKTESKDSVDVYIIVHDKWPVTIPFNLKSTSSGSARVRNKNLFGVGQQFEQYVSYKYPEDYVLTGYYQIENIDETYISARGYYETSKSGTNLGILFDRPFYSPLAKWAGGIAMTKWWRYYEYTDTLENAYTRVNLDNTGFDAWAAKSTKLSEDLSFFNQSTNIITGLRYSQNTFQRRPSFSIDTAKLNRNTRTIIGNAGVAVQQYYKEKYIYRFGATEDVPEGLIMQVIYGGKKTELETIRYYAGAEIASARHFSAGYFSASLGYGVMFNTRLNNDITTRLKVYYFSDLVKRGQWYFRQFINYDLVNGINKNHQTRITIQPEELYGFKSGGVSGNTKMIFNLETVAYAPYKVVGFKFAPILMMGFGMIGDPSARIQNSPLYQAYALGILVRNENLLTSTFQITAGFYPFLPDGRKNVFTYSPVTSFTLRVRGFSVGKPDFIGY
jgi:hypothetical protein